MNALFIGNGSLLMQCAQIWLDRGQQISGVVTDAPEIHDWAVDQGFAVFGDIKQVPDLPMEWLFSVANLKMLPAAFLARAKHGTVNFHDGPLPRYAGLNAPVWALLAGEKTHGITWHLMQDRADTGGIIDQRHFDITADDTALSLNTKCYAAGIDGFAALLDPLIDGTLAPVAQDLTERQYFRRDARPHAAGLLDFTGSADAAQQLVRALDHGPYANPLAVAKFLIGEQLVLVGKARVLRDRSGPAGQVLAVDADGITVACGADAIHLTDLCTTASQEFDTAGKLKLGDVLATADLDAITTMMAPQAVSEPALSRELQRVKNADMALVGATKNMANWKTQPLDLGGDRQLRMAAIGAFAALHGQSHLALGLGPKAAHVLLNPWMPLATPNVDATLKAAQNHMRSAGEAATRNGPFTADLLARFPALRDLRTPAIGITQDGRGVMGTALSFQVDDGKTLLHFDQNRVTPAGIEILVARLVELAGSNPATKIDDMPRLSNSERDLVLAQWNATQKPYDGAPIHQQFETFAAKNPKATAMVFEGQNLDFETLNNRANVAAATLAAMGVGIGDRVGLYLKRSPEMIVALLATLKAGAAYVPLDPGFPANRIAHYIADSGAKIIVAQADLIADLPGHDAQVLDINSLDANASAANPKVGVTKDDLAYLIYTSGSTGTPKGVMVEHGNVTSFMAAMDDRISHKKGDTWLAVTSLSFDISVLELLFTLTRGIKLVLSGDDARLLVSNRPPKNNPMDFSLYYWGNDDATGAKKYELLLEGAKYADQNGFVAVWTPERHFHAFGGPYPNPAVTGAAVAAVTKNLAVRAGSCVAPLHHPARIAEEWAVIDNLTGGRVGLAVASGWQPDDFVLRPENTPPANKPALFDTIKILRRLWAGEAVEFPTATGTPHAVVTQPRPLSKTLPIWVTSAGNPDTWVEAANLGAHVLTHLLGQSVAEVGEKIKIYHAALRAAGRDPRDFKVTVMLHTLIGADREVVREIAREPMKDYLRSAAGLIKQYAYAFPAFKRPKGAQTSLDLGTLEPDELEAILDFAFTRYFEDSGLFGTPQDAARRVAELQAIGVDEVACLIDYGIDTQQVLAGLRPLAAVVAETNATRELAADDFSIAAQIERHAVTHLQCTPSMAHMMLADPASRAALGELKHILLGGEALGHDLLNRVRDASKASIQNMYGPTETTIWSSSEMIGDATGAVANIGTPIANTQVYVLDAAQNPVAIGEQGELFIGGHGVTRGYWQRAEMTAEKFLPNPFLTGRMYRTGDLVRWRDDGKLDFLGRADQQVKLRGFRIELGEIETALCDISTVDQAVVIPREDRPGDVRLVAYLRTSLTIDPVELRQKLSAQLAEYMVPAHFIRLEEFPLTPNKKIDRSALPAPQSVAAIPKAPAKSAVPPQDNISEADLRRDIALIWREILSVPAVAPQDNFFDLGGHSLLAVQTHRAIRERLNLPDLSITDIFRYPTLAGLCAQLAAPTEEPKATTTAPTMARTDTMARRRAMRAARLQNVQPR